MTDTPTPDKPTNADRIAKVIARAGLASRRDAERMILDGRVTVNGAKIDSPALNVLPSDRITVDGKKLDEPQETRLWLYFKPLGLVTTESDEKGRRTVFDALPRDLPRVLSVGRLDLNSEGLLLLTNDGELKRRLELPTTGWLRRYRVRVNGQPSDLTFAPLRRGVTIDGEDFAPMEIKLDSQKGANAWLTVGIREGKNREIRRAMAHVGLQVNRLIRVGYGPFKLGEMEPGALLEVRRRVLRDQLGGLLTGESEGAEPGERPFRPRGAGGERGEARGEPGRKPFQRRDDRGGKEGAGQDRARQDRSERPFRRRDDDQGRSFARRDEGDPSARHRGDASGKPFVRRRDGDGDRPFARRDGEGPRKPRGDGKPFTRRDGEGPRKPRGDGKPFTRRDGEGPRKPRGDGKPFARRDGEGPRKPRGDGKPFARRDGEGSRPPRGDGKPFARRDGEGPRKPRGDGKPFANRDRDAGGGRGPRKPGGAGPRGPRPGNGTPRGKPGPKPGGKPRS